MESDPLIIVRALLIVDNRILVCKSKTKPITFLPGGKREEGETVEDSLYREVLEELGQECEIVCYLGAIEHHWKDGMGIHIGLNHFFQVKIEGIAIDTPLKCLDSDVDLSWIKLDEIDNIDLQPKPLISLLRSWLKGKNKAWWAVHIDWKRGLEG